MSEAGERGPDYRRDDVARGRNTGTMHRPSDDGSGGEGLSPAALGLAVDRAPEAIAILDDDRRHLYANEAYARLYRFDDPDKLRGLKWDTLFPEDVFHEIRTEILPALREDRTWRGEVQISRNDEEGVTQEISLSRLPDGRVLCVVRDASERSEELARLERMAYYDPLTGLANRRLLREKAEQAFALARRRGHEVGLLYLDLDDFKELNDTLGHAAGDRALEIVAERVLEVIREADTAARVGGDEFAVLLSEVGGEDAGVQVAHRILQDLGEPVDIDGHSVRLRAGIGMTLFPRYASDFDELVRQADLAMYGAAREKRHGVRVFRPEHRFSSPRHSTLLDDLHQALRHYRLELHFQPIASLETGRPVGGEALVRWPHPRLGTLAAAKFLPLVEDAGLVQRLDRWVVATTLLQMDTWRREGYRGWIAFHLSRRTCSDPDFLDYLRTALASVPDTSPERLVLEIPVRFVLDRPDEYRRLAEGISSTGAGVAVNAFGPEGDSLVYLEHHVPDMVNVSHTALERGRGEGLRVLADLVHRLGGRVLAKGVERPWQRELVRDVGFDYAVGYLEGWTLPPEHFVEEVSPSLVGNGHKNVLVP